MTFLNPLVLFGLIAAAIPVLLHLLSLRKLRTIEFSTLRFIKELQRTRIRRLKLRQILLLILRTLLIVLIVLAFSRPTVKGNLIGGVTTEAKSSAVILIDDSFSMTASDIHGEYLKQAKESSNRILALFNDGDEVSVSPLSEAAAHNGDPRTLLARRPGESAAVIADIKPSPVHRKLEDGLRAAARFLSTSRNLNKEVYIISDFQAGLLTKDRAARESLFVPGVRVFSVPIGQREPRNLSVQSLEIPDAIIEVGKPFVLKAVLSNHTQSEVRNHIVSVFLDGTRVAQRGTTLDAGGSLDVEFSLVPKRSGNISGFVEIEDDDLSYDNRRYFSMNLPEQIRVLLVGTKADLRYIATALSTRQEGGSVLRTQETAYDRLTSTLMAEYDVLVLSGIKEVTSLQSEALLRFVSGGGGLILFPGPDTTPAGFVQIQDRLRLPRLEGIESPGKDESSSFVELDRAELRHPLFRGMFRDEDLDVRNKRPQSLESPRIRSYARFRPGDNTTPLITVSGGSPFLLEERLASGRILLFAVSADLSFSDLPLKGVFVPLIHRSVAYAAQEQVRQPSVLSGEEITVAGILQPLATIVTPRGFELPVILRQGGARFLETEEPGMYQIRSGDAVFRTFTVNMDPDESLTLRSRERDLLVAYEHLGIQRASIRTINDASNLRGVILETRHGVELWKQFLLAALIVALAESLLARENKKALAQFSTEPA